MDAALTYEGPIQQQTLIGESQTPCKKLPDDAEQSRDPN